MRVSVLLLTLNEEKNLPRCLGALSWCNDIVVLDSGSVDDSVKIAKAAGARVLVRPFDNFANQRNFGIAHGEFRHPWLLHLDADEVLTPAFVSALESLEPPSNINAYHVPSKIMFFGKWLRHAGMWPSYQVRLGRLDQLRFAQVGHGQREDLAPDCIGTFPEPYLHFSFSHGMYAWLSKHLQYAADEIDALAQAQGTKLASISGRDAIGRRRLLKAAVGRLPLTARPFLKFFYVFFLRVGFLDGYRGFAYAFMLAVYEGMIAVLGFERLGQVNWGRLPPVPLLGDVAHREPHR